MRARRIRACRICGSKNLIPIFSLGNLFISNFVKDSRRNWPRAPLTLVLCEKQRGGCGLLQLAHTVPEEILYRNQYWYVSGTNQSMREALTDIAQRAEKLISLKVGDLVLDIGCNDGTLLRAYTIPGIIRVGFEPARNLMKISRVGTTRIINDFFRLSAFRKYFPRRKAKIVTATAMFYDLDNPNDFVADVKECLAEDGVWIIQMSYLPMMLEQNAFDNICHEHLEYYSMGPLKYLLDRHGLEIFDVELNDVNGGSFRIFIRYHGSRLPKPFLGAEGRIKKLMALERKLRLDKKKIYMEFARRILHIKRQLVHFIKKEVARGKTIYVYGASTKGNTLLQYFGLNSRLLKAAAERNPAKFGKKTAGSWIPIISEAEARKAHPDYFLILPWHFKKEFLKREKDFLRNGGRFIFPLPKVEIYGANT